MIPVPGIAKFGFKLSNNLPAVPRLIAARWNPRLPFAAAAATSARNSPKTLWRARFARRRADSGRNTRISSCHERPPIHLSHAGSDQDLPGRRKKVLDNIHLSFYPDAKIGVLGVNGSGKSTLLRIMAGIDTDFTGEGWVAEGARVGYLEQEPQLDADKDRARERHGGRRRQEGAARPLQRDRRQLFRRDRRRDGEAAGRDRLQEPVGPRQPGRSGDGRAALPARRRRRHQALGRRAPPRRALQAAARPARPAAARRADQPSRRRERELAGRPSAQLSGRHPDRHPRPLLPRQRHRLDPRARSRPRHSLRGQLHLLAGAEAEAHGAGRPRGRGAPAHARARERVDFLLAEGAAGQIEGALPALRGAAQDRQRQGQHRGADHHPGGRAARPERGRFRRT